MPASKTKAKTSKSKRVPKDGRDRFYADDTSDGAGDGYEEDEEDEEDEDEPDPETLRREVRSFYSNADLL